MKEKTDYVSARDILLSHATPVTAQREPLELCGGRILAQTVAACQNVPDFDRSPYDGYAFRAADAENASAENPVTLRILEEIPAGTAPSKEIVPGTAAKVLTGAAIPVGADAVIMYEKTEFSEETVTIFSASKPGDNIIYAGEDVKKGDILATPGMVIDPGLAGTLASQGVYHPYVYRKPLVGIISTGSELMEEEDLATAEAGSLSCKTDSSYTKKTAGQILHTTTDEAHGHEHTLELPAGKIRNTNRYSIAMALQKDGCDTVYLGTAGDDVQQIARMITGGLKIPSDDLKREFSGTEKSECEFPEAENRKEDPVDSRRRPCDMIILTGGVSAGDYDLTPDAMKSAGCELLVNGVDIKPGMACCYGVKDGTLVCALSGNPASSLTNYCAVVRPAVRKLSGLAGFLPEEFDVTLEKGFGKKSKSTRFLKGKLKIKEGMAVLDIPKGQGNVMISSSIGCDCMAVVPAGSGALEAGTRLRAFSV